MKADDLKKWILSLEQDIEFEYNNIGGSICPFSKNDISLTFLDISKDYEDIDELMNDKVISGKSLNEISQELKFL